MKTSPSEDKQKLPSFEGIQMEIQNILETFDSNANDLDEYSTELNPEQMAELDDYLEALGVQEAQKVDGFGQFLRMSEAQEASLKAEADRLRKRAKTLENTRNYLKMRYLQVMEQHGLKKVAGSVYTLSRRATKVVQIMDEKALPADLWREKVTREPAKTDIMALLKIGQEVPGCALSESYSLQVR